MANREFLIESEIWEGKNIWTKARVVGEDNVPLVQADVTSYSLSVFDLNSDTSETAVYTFTATSASSVVFNSLQLDTSWRKDTVGYNFKHEVAYDAFTQQGGHVYLFEYELDTDDGPVPVMHKVTCKSRHRV